MKELSKKEKLYYRLLKPNSGVLYLTSKPGLGKSAIIKSIADKLNIQHIDLRLSMMDETDLGLYPSIADNGDVKYIEHLPPKWAVKANERETIIVFDELNRASLNKRNASLQILNERRIGDFVFNDNVYMAACGNLGDDDDTDVEEFDSALNNRLIHVEHSLPTEEWIRDYAEGKIHPIIIKYLKIYPEKLYHKNENDKAYATPRSWSFLSNYITYYYGIDSSIDDIKEELEEVSKYYIGHPQSLHFKDYCERLTNFGIEDILKDFDKYENELKKYNRDKYSELIESLKSINILKLPYEKVLNLKKFLNIIQDDERYALVVYLIEKYPLNNKTIGKNSTFDLLFNDYDYSTLTEKLTHGKNSRFST